MSWTKCHYNLAGFLLKSQEQLRLICTSFGALIFYSAIRPTVTSFLLWKSIVFCLQKNEIRSEVMVKMIGYKWHSGCLTGKKCVIARWLHVYIVILLRAAWKCKRAFQRDRFYPHFSEGAQHVEIVIPPSTTVAVCYSTTMLLTYATLRRAFEINSVMSHSG